MNTVELFSGTKSFSKVMAAQGHSIFTVDNESYHNPDLLADVNYLDYELLPKHPDILWASPPCTAFSVASIGKHWGGGHRMYIPKTESAKIAKETVLNTIALIQKVNPKWWFIENPRGVLRKMHFMQSIRRVTITYCQYGDTRMKPTDIWTNAYWWSPRPTCKNGDKCHESAPRGSKTGTQGLKGSKDRGRIPPEIFEEILAQIPLTLNKLDMKLVVIESPYSGDVEGNIAYLKACIRDSLAKGEAPYASHLFYTQEGILDDTKPEERRQGMEAGFAWGAKADWVAVYEDRGVSEGMKIGIERAHKQGIPVIYRKLYG